MTRSIPPSIWIIGNASFNLQGARMVDQDFIDIVATLPISRPLGTPNTIKLHEQDNFIWMI